MNSVIFLPEATGEWIGHHFPLGHYFRYSTINLKGIFIITCVHELNLVVLNGIYKSRGNTTLVPRSNILTYHLSSKDVFKNSAFVTQGKGFFPHFLLQINDDKPNLPLIFSCLIWQGVLDSQTNPWPSSCIIREVKDKKVWLWFFKNFKSFFSERCEEVWLQRDLLTWGITVVSSPCLLIAPHISQKGHF